MKAPWQSLYFVSAGALMCAFAVALGAFGAHVFQPTFTQLELDTYRTAVLYQFVHGFGMVLAGLLCRFLKRKAPCAWAGALFLLGIVVFCFSLFAITIFGAKALGAVAPIGGLCFMAGWCLLVWASYGGWEDPEAK
jgi:uncharacterized membrane protein YgdD (TMEM256/DUF423 family)